MMTVEKMLHLMQNGKQFSFRRFMETALYSIDGYYNRFVKIGGGGADFYTAVQFPLFALTLVNAIVAAWKRLDCPEQLQVVELGAGQGELALAIGNRLKKMLPDVRIQYVIVEKAFGLIDIQKNNLANDIQIHDTSHLQRMWGMPDISIDSVVIGNEVLDALPIERLRKGPFQWERGYVAIGSDKSFQEVWRKAPVWLAHMADHYLPIPTHQTSELCTVYKGFAKKCKEYGKRVELIFADYGITHSELAEGIRFSGTVRGYHHHQICEPFANPGEIDITADVQWHIFQDALSRVGFHDISVVLQGEFLLAHGILPVYTELREETCSKNPIDEMKLTGQLKQLILPGGFGERFQILNARI